MQIIIAFLFLTTFLSANPIPGNFDQVQTEGGGWQTGFAQHPNGRLYCRTDVGGVYRSDDFGDSWNYLSSNFTSLAPLLVQGLAVSPNDADLVLFSAGASYVGTDPNRGIWKSVNGGTTWTQVATGLNFSGNDDERQGGEALIFHPNVSTELFAVTRGQGLYRSTNTGDSWSKIGGTTFDGVNLAGVSIHPNFPNQVFVYGSGGCWYSLDRGQNFTPLFTSNLCYRVVRKDDGTFFASDSQPRATAFVGSKLWRYTASDWNNPSTWTRTDILPNYADAAAATADQLSAVQILANGDLFVAAFFRNHAISSDNGDTFTRTSRGLTGTVPQWQTAPGQVVPSDELGGGFNQLLQDATNSNRLFLTGGYGISRSEDRGQSWEHITNGINEIVCWQVQFHPTDPQKILLPMADHALAVLPDQSSSLLATNYNARHFAYPNDIINFVHTAFYSGSRIIAPGAEAIGQNLRLYLSNDDGVNWERMETNGLPENTGSPIVDGLAATDNPDELLVLVGGSWSSTQGGVYRSTDAGLNFTRSNMPAEALSNGNGGSYFGGTEFVWFNDLHADGEGSDTRYLMQRFFRILRSSDRGQTWETITPSGLTGAATFFNGQLATDPNEEGRLWMAVTDGLWTSTDSGESFTPVGDFTFLNPDVRFSALDGRVVVRGRRPGDTFEKIYYSPDNGLNWGEITRENARLPDTQAMSLDPYRPGTVWISTGGQSVLKFTPSTPTIVNIKGDSDSVTLSAPGFVTPPRVMRSPDLVTPFVHYPEAILNPDNTFTIPIGELGPAHFFRLEP